MVFFTGMVPDSLYLAPSWQYQALPPSLLPFLVLLLSILRCVDHNRTQKSQTLQSHKAYFSFSSAIIPTTVFASTDILRELFRGHQNLFPEKQPTNINHCLHKMLPICSATGLHLPCYLVP